ncbi:MAG: cytochrome c-type biogenesis protein CcmH [Halioglobus sp.]
MTTFLLVCGGLLAFTAVFFLFPKKVEGTSEDDLARANVEWYRLRQSELANEPASADEEKLAEEARLRLQEDEQKPRIEITAVPRAFPVWILIPFMVAASSTLYFLLGAAPDVIIEQQLSDMDEDITPDEMSVLIESIEERSDQRPDNLHYLALLGRYYMGGQDYQKAAATYETLVLASPEDAQALAYAAQAEYLAAERTLSDRARLRAEQALAADPRQRTALGLLGMASFEQQKYRAAIEYWQRLVQLEPAGSENAKMIADVIASARLNLGESVADGSVVPEQSVGAGVTVQVSLPDGATIAATDTVFVLARHANSDSRMPIAVQRLSAMEFPFELRLDDSSSMAGQKISDTASVIVAVQVSPSGSPGAVNASWMGEAGPISPSVDGAAIAIVLQPNGVL